MNWSELERHFSAARLGRYYRFFAQDADKAAEAYAHNLLLAEAMMPMLNVLEIALRNGINARLSKHYGRIDWWEAWLGAAEFNWQNKEIANTKAKLTRKKEVLSADKIVAELTFGFWTSLFNTTFQAILWKDLRLVFPCCPKSIRQRHTISSALNQARDLRNRVFHHEPLLWLAPALIEQYTASVEIN
jgi:hypothetical protein